MCELALRRAGGGGDGSKRIVQALDLFLHHRDGLAKEVGKVLMHAGPAGQGCHYPMFDYAFAAAAVRELPEDERDKYRKPILELLMATRSVEGLFRDTEFNGWDYGTAMALMALWSLR